MMKKAMACALGLGTWLYAQPLSAATVLTVGSRSGSEGATIFVPVQLFSDTNVTALQFDVVYDPAKLVSEVVFGGDAIVDHAIGSRVLTNGLRRVVIYSAKNTPLTNGILTSLPFTIVPGAPLIAIPITVTNIVAIGPDGKPAATSGSVSATLTVAKPAPAAFGTVMRGFDKTVRFQMTGAEGRRYLIESSADLNVWTPIRTNQVVQGILIFNEPVPTGSVRFYRSSLLPP